MNTNFSNCDEEFVPYTGRQHTLKLSCLYVSRAINHSHVLRTSMLQCN